LGDSKGVEISFAAVTWLERNYIIIYMYSKHNVKLVWFGMRQQNFIACKPKFIIFAAFDI